MIAQASLKEEDARRGFENSGVLRITIRSETSVAVQGIGGPLIMNKALELSGVGKSCQQWRCLMSATLTLAVKVKFTLPLKPIPPPSASSNTNAHSTSGDQSPEIPHITSLSKNGRLKIQNGRTFKIHVN